MNFHTLFARSHRLNTVDQILRNQILWMLLLRIVLYTLLLGLNYVFNKTSLDLILIPKEVMIVLLLCVYTITIASAFHVFTTSWSLRKIGFIQNLLDTCFATILVYYTGISLSSFTSVYFFPIIAGGLILPRKGGLVSAAASTLLYGTILLLELLEYYPDHIIDLGYRGTDDYLVALNHFSIHGLIFFLAAILSALFSIRIKSTETALSDSLKSYDRLSILYKQIFDNIGTGIITIDDRDVITSANNAAERITGFPIHSLVGRNTGEFLPGFNLTAPRMRQAANFIRLDGKKIRIGYSHVDLRQPDNKDSDSIHHHKIITLRDISELEQLERQMRQAEKLAAIGMMSASIAHDFRNPLTAISGSAQILTNEFSKESTENIVNYELSHIILRESNRMIGTISDFLKFSRPESADREWFSLNGCLNEVIQVCRADPSWPFSTEIVVKVDGATDIWADRNQMSTVFNHLIQNAIAFCPPGAEHIEIKAEENKEEEKGDTISISISDNGTGVPSDSQEKIFEPFFTSRADGTGLGLAIVKQTIEEHSGSITVGQSGLGGACFIVSLPLPS